MGSIFKKVKKIVSKVVSPVTKLFKKIGKGIVKVGKDIWGGIKKIGGKALKAYGKISQKLGPIGMIGLSMAMPYLLGAFGTSAGGLWSGFGKFMGGTITNPAGQVVKTGLMGSQNPFFKVMGHVGKGIYNAGNFVGGTTRGISQTISKSFGSFAKGDVSQGFANLWKGTGEVLSGKAGMGTMGYTPVVGKEVMGTQLKSFYNPKYITQTGGVRLGNVNIANQFNYDAVKQAMLKNPSYLQLDKASRMYHRTVVNKAGVDWNLGLDYINQNGVTDGVLDMALSTDFKWAAPPSQSMVEGATKAAHNYSWSGANIDKTMKAWNLQAGGGYKWQPEEEGDIYQTQESLLKKPNLTEKMLNAAHKVLSDDQDDTLPYVYGKANQYKATNANAAWLASNMGYSAHGGAITEEMMKYYQSLEGKKLMDINPQR
jgi:hypothetical protein